MTNTVIMQPPQTTFVTVSGKTHHIAIFAKIAIALYLSSATNLAPNLRPIARSISGI